MITAYAQTRQGSITTVTVTSDLTGTIYYHWYIDGAWIGFTETTSKSIALEPGEHVRVEVIDTNDADFDPIANAPTGWPARQTMWWTASIASDIAAYRVEQQKDGGAWSSIATVPHIQDQWTYSFLTAPLVDLSDYAWRVIPIDQAGNEGTPVSLAVQGVVRRPDAPNFTVSYDDQTERVTFAAAA